MKLNFFSLILFTPILLLSQQHWNVKDNVKWEIPIGTNGDLIQHPKSSIPFEGAVRSNLDPQKFLYRKEFPVNGPGSITATLLSFDEETYNLTTLSKEIRYSNEYQLKSGISKERSTYTAWIELTPIRMNPSGQFHRILNVEFDLNFIPNFAPPQLPPFTKNSVLETGQIFKISVSKKGIYKIDKNYLEKNLKINVANIDPRNIHIYGNGGQKLPESNDQYREDDLVENAIYVAGESDQIFNDQDYILFYATGPDIQTYDASINDYINIKNPYSQKSYFYIKINDKPGKRISEKPELFSPSFTTNQSLETIHHQKELTNIIAGDQCNHGTGQQWFGEELSNSRELDFGTEFSFPELDPTKTAKVSCVFATRATQGTQLIININDSKIVKNLSPISSYQCTYKFAENNTIKSDLKLNSSATKVNIKFPISSSDSEGWLDWFQITSWKNLIWNGVPMYVLNPEASSFQTTAYTINNANTTLTTWDVTQPLNISSVKNNTINNTLTFVDESFQKNNQYVVFNAATANAQPDFNGTVENQNLHMLDNLDFAIIYHASLKDEALRLLKHRQQFSSLVGVAVDIEQIYNEFSSGTKDPTSVRDFARMLYSRNTRFKYLTLFGSASYDYRYLNTKNKDLNLVPTYETPESLDPIYGFPSDDYFGLLDNGEGENLNGKLDIAVGRIISRTIDEARIMVDKIIRYDTDPLTLGDWRLNNLFTADDEDGNTHFYDMDRIAIFNQEKNKNINQQKVYLDAYEQVSTPGGERYPEVTKAINDAIFQGNFVYAYMGHGGPTGLAQERVLQEPDIKVWDNIYKMPLMITATCTFTSFDDPSITSAGNLTLLNKGGVIGLFSTVRPVYADANYILTRDVFDQLYNIENGKHLTMGEILKRAKNKNGSSENTRKFMLFGDPSQTLAYPKLENEILSINDKPLSQSPDTLRALQTVKIKGRVIQPGGNIVSDFNGILNATIFDKEITLKTRRNDPGSNVSSFNIQKNIIFKGSTEVKDGIWEFSFIIPKDINYSFGAGKISLYASNLKDLDAAGYTDHFIVGGFKSDTLLNDQPPVVNLFMNNDQFANGGITDENPKIFAKISDDLGINITGNSIGHDLTAIIDQNSQSPIILNNYFKSKLNDFKSGEVTYPLKNLASGKHTLTVTAWDISNKMGSANIEFNVLNKDAVSIDRVYNYPNPFSKHTQFQFETNWTGIPLEINIYIQTITGKLVKTITKRITPDGYRITNLDWDGKDDFGSDLANGVYVYQIKINGELDGEIIKKQSKIEKLLILK